MFNIEEQVKKLPKSPGVYIMKDKNGVIIYIGKSKDLSKRVKSYFRSFNSKRLKVQTMVKNIHEFEYFITDTEQEALILEANLIKKHMPRFNILLRDDKKYPYICVSLNEEYPRVFMTRDLKKDGNRYFGPYTSAYAVHTTIDAINNSFNIRKCNRDLSKSYERPCLNFHIKKCLGPCTGRVNYEQYMEKINEIIEILDGNQSILIDALEEQMKTAAAELNFEIAADYRDKIDAIRALQEKQRINSVKGEIYDVISYYQTEDRICIMVFFIRGGNLIGRDKFTFDSDKVDDVLSSFILQFYSGIKMIPKNILVKEAIEDQAIIENWLSDIKGKKVTITVPKIGEKKKQVDLVTKNAKEFILKFEEKINFEKKFISSSLSQLKKLLELNDLHRIEAYDISNIYGVYSVGSMVVYENGKKKSNAYRRFKIKTVEGSDDYTSMQEVIYRRFKRGKDELDKINKNELTVDRGKFNVFPNLLLIDGGKGHVSVVQKVLNALNIDLPVCGMVKDDYHKTRGLYYKGEEIHFGQNKYAYQLIYKIQEEVHRFAINYHKSLRRSNMTKSVLDEISGIGESRKISLMKHFEKIENVKRASVEELCEVKGISEKIAEKIYSFFNS
jgi:excinuclease ABC subunit C